MSVKKLLVIFTNLVVAALVAVICLNVQHVAAKADVDPFITGYEQGFQAGYAQGYTTAAVGSEKSQLAKPEAIAEVLADKPQLEEFASLEELRGWLAKDDIDKYVYLFCDDDGVARLSGRYDCDDYALELQYRAAVSGFLLSATIINGPVGPHMINMAVIGNDIYYVEPQDDNVWLYCQRD